MNPINLTEYFGRLQAEYEANQQKLVELEAEQSALRNILFKRTKPYPGARSIALEQAIAARLASATAKPR